MSSPDTIAAISSAVGPAARMIVRVSGPGAIRVAAAVGVGIDGQLGPHALAERVPLRFAGLTLPAWVYTFRAPRSYTGDDLVEFHIPGNPICAKLLMDALLVAGARPAEAGEFTARAYFNGRIDLTGAEGVAATIAAQNEQELDAARRLLAGELAQRLAPPMERIARTLALVEVGIDFSEEEVSFLSGGEVVAEASATATLLRDLVNESARFERVSHEPRFVLVGRPNAGKSTLLNALAGSERAVTSPVAGTTRDALSAEVVLPRGIVHVTDVAGIEEAAAAPAGSTSPAQHEIDYQMRRRALRVLESADFILLVREAGDMLPVLAAARQPHLAVRSKIDLKVSPSPTYPGERAEVRGRSAMATGETDRHTNFHKTSELTPIAVPHARLLTPALSPEYGGEGAAELRISAMTGSGLETLRNAMDDLAFGRPAARSTLALNARHLAAIGEAIAALDRVASAGTTSPAELLALELREALDALGRVLGQVTPDDLLGKIFSSFCIGK